MYFLLHPVYAAESTSLCGVEGCDSSLCETGNVIIADIFSFTAFNEMDKSLSSLNNSMSGLVSLANQALSPYGLAFLCTWFVLDIIEAMTASQASSELLLKKFVYLIGAAIIINEADSWTIEIPKLCIGMSKDVTEALSDPQSLGKIRGIGRLYKYWHNEVTLDIDGFSDFILKFLPNLNKLFMAFLFIIILLFLDLVAMVCGLLVFLIKASACIEMAVFGACFSIGISDMTKGSGSSSTRYLKKYISKGFTFIVVAIIVSCGAAIASDMAASILSPFSNADDYLKTVTVIKFLLVILEMILMYVVTIATALKANRLAGEILGG